ncbi:MAG: alpha/beta fold hydrolase [Acidimicrobiales bacterium]
MTWAHPTTGVAAHCAPSTLIDPFAGIEGLRDLLDAGFVVAATDYPGMGVPGPNIYLIGEVEGHSVLDAARAAENLTDSGAGNDVLGWGHSQGGQAALFAAQLAPTYAPDLDFLGVAVAAPAVELGALVDDHQDDVSGVTIGSYTLDAYSSAYGQPNQPISLEGTVQPAGIPVVSEIVERCLLTENAAIRKIADPVVGRFFAVDVGTTEPWSSLLAENTPGAVPIGVPMFIAQGQADKLVEPATTANYVQQLCAAGEHVQFDPVADVTHGGIALNAAPKVATWMSDLVAGRTVPDTC